MFKLLAQKTGRDLSKLVATRSIHVTTSALLKKINVTEDKEKNLLTIEAEYINPSEKFGKTLSLVDSESDQATRPCILCELGIDKTIEFISVA